MEQSTFFEPEKTNIRYRKGKLGFYSKHLISVKKFLIKVISNIKQTTYADMRKIRKKFWTLNKDKFNAQDRSEFEKVEKLLEKLNQTHPELCSKDIYMQSESFKKNSKESTFDRPNLTNDPNLSKNLLQVSYQRSVVQESSAAIKKPKKNPVERSKKIISAKNSKKIVEKKPKKIPVKKPKIKNAPSTSKEIPSIADQNVSKTPVASLTRNKSVAEDDEETKKKKIRQYIEWAQELQVVLYKKQEESISGR